MQSSHNYLVIPVIFNIDSHEQIMSPWYFYIKISSTVVFNSQLESIVL